MNALIHLVALIGLSSLMTSCMSTFNKTYDEGADPYASIGYEDDALLGSVDLKSPVMVAEDQSLDVDLRRDPASSEKVAVIKKGIEDLDIDDDELSLEDVEDALAETTDTEEEVEEMTEAIAAVEPEMPQTQNRRARKPASVQLVPTGNTATIVYTPLWIKIPLGECLEVVKNRNYENGACIKRRL